MSRQDGWAIKGPDGVLRTGTFEPCTDTPSSGRRWNLLGLGTDEFRRISDCLSQDFNNKRSRKGAAKSLGYTLVPVQLVEVGK